MAQSITILNVEDDDDDADILAHALSGAPGRQYQLHRTSTLAGLPGAIESTRPDLILLDLHLPDTKGTDTVQTAMSYAADIPILVLTGSSNEQFGRTSIEAGAQDFIPKGELLTPQLTRSIDFAIQRKRLHLESEQRALTDPLTGLSNRAGLLRHLIAATARVRRHGRGFALAFLDLDGFKGINDTLGHAAGDAVLIEIAKRAQALARANDGLFRLGGDEFVFYLDGVQTRARARQAAARYAAAVEKPIVLDARFGSARVTVGASFGLAVCPIDSLDAEKLMTVADHSMYERKRAKQASVGQLIGNHAAAAADRTGISRT